MLKVNRKILAFLLAVMIAASSLGVLGAVSFAALEPPYKFRLDMQTTQGTDLRTSASSSNTYVALYGTNDAGRTVKLGSYFEAASYKSAYYTTANATGKTYTTGSATPLEFTTLPDRIAISVAFKTQSSNNFRATLVLYMYNEKDELVTVHREKIDLKPGTQTSGARTNTATYSIDTSVYADVIDPEKPYVSDAGIWGSDTIVLPPDGSPSRSNYRGGGKKTGYTVSALLDQKGEKWTSAPEWSVDSDYAEIYDTVFIVRSDVSNADDDSIIARVCFSAPADGKDYTVNLTVKYASENEDHPETAAVFPISVYAPHTVEINADGGEYDGETTAILYTDAAKSEHYKASTMTLAQPKKDGYTFGGWTIDGEGSISGGNTLFAAGNGSAVLKATWIEVPTEEQGTTEPEPTEPGTTESEPAEPGATEPGTTKPEPTEPGTTEPGTTKPEPTEPEPTEHGTTEPESTELESTELESTEPESAEPSDTNPPASTVPAASVPSGRDTGRTTSGKQIHGELCFCYDYRGHGLMAELFRFLCATLNVFNDLRKALNF